MRQKFLLKLSLPECPRVRGRIGNFGNVMSGKGNSFITPERTVIMSVGLAIPSLTQWMVSQLLSTSKLANSICEQK
jgi:hypothetical protein